MPIYESITGAALARSFENVEKQAASIPYSRYFPYLPGRVADYLNIDSIDLRKERVDWLAGLTVTYTMNEISERFYSWCPR